MSTNYPPLNTDLNEGQGFRAFHTFMRGARRFMETDVWQRGYDDYTAAADALDEAPADPDAALPVLDRLPAFQLHAWMFRNLQRFKYTYPEYGIVPAAQAERPRIEKALEASLERGVARGKVRLNRAQAYPDYYAHVDFHQHPGGVWSDPLDGVVYDVARRTTIAAHMDPNMIYRQLFDNLPRDRTYDRVLDWGLGHGSGLLTWMEMHPESEAHGVDLSAPCLSFAWNKAEEKGLEPTLSQQDVAHLDYPDNHFDLIFFVFMLHEIPPGPTPAILREVYRVLKPGGRFMGIEFRPVPGAGPFERAMLVHSQWCNNEVFSPAFFKFPLVETAREIGFSNAEIRPLHKTAQSVSAEPGRVTAAPPYAQFVVIDLEK
jgi:ubiquinone/menaquinone biosynthesis C-methylase UbiE